MSISRAALRPLATTRAAVSASASAPRRTSWGVSAFRPPQSAKYFSAGRSAKSRLSAAEEPKAEVKVAEPVAPEACEDVCSFDSPQEAPEGYSEKSDMFKAIGGGSALILLAYFANSDWVAHNESPALIFAFLLGYAGIILEEELTFNKSGVALLMAVFLWTIRSLTGDHAAVDAALESSLSEISEIIFFLIGAMTIVEIVDSHQGFKIITDLIKTRSKTSLMWIIGIITFCLSAILDNLTSTIVMVSLLRKLVPNDAEYRKFLGAVVVIAANSGGAWSPIGDVTTTMLWINGNISTVSTMRDLVFPSVLSLLIPMGLMSQFADETKGELQPVEQKAGSAMAPRGQLVFGVGVGALLFVPVFKTLTGLPPCLGMLLGLGALWTLTDAIHYGEDSRDALRVPNALTRIDTQGTLFFLGILMAIAALEDGGVLRDLAVFLNDNLPNQEIIAALIGVVSAVVDNVPLVAATMGMYDLNAHPMDDSLWQLIAYCAGTGGSMLIIGSAAGVAFMGLENAEFMWYVKKVTPWAAAGYFGGIGGYILQSNIAPMMAALPAVTHTVL